MQGFDSGGEEQFWTVAGDQVTSLAFCDVDKDGTMELVVSCWSPPEPHVSCVRALNWGGALILIWMLSG